MKRISFASYLLNFKEPAGTSRGVFYSKPTFFVRIEDDSEKRRVGYGEIPIFPGLSKESAENVVDILSSLQKSPESIPDHIGKVSSVTFGLETALQDLQNGGVGILFPSSFTGGCTVIDINGLIWMGDYGEMMKRLEEKLKEGFRCIKIRIGAIQWERELDLLRHIREKCGNKTTIRVDANGAFTPRNCMMFLEQLASLNVHSIEQPIKAGNYDAMAEICRNTPVPVALDEELIGLAIGDRRHEMLETIRPQFIILKPALWYGFSGMEDWISLADSMNIGWWVTSALESSIGLNAIAQFVGKYNLTLPQGLGTGQLYTNNLVSSVSLQGDKMHFAGFPLSIYRQQMENLDWK